jgi:hypothetical protein
VKLAPPMPTSAAASAVMRGNRRHIYATLRIAAHHPTLYIESSMGTGLVGKVYGGVIRRYEGKGPLEIDAEINAARQAALAKRPLELRWP